MKTDKLLHLIQQKNAMRSGGALPLPKAQSGRTKDGFISYTSNPEYFDSHAVYHDNSNYNDQIRRLVYAGTHEYNPSTGELRKLKKPVKVPADTQQMATKEYTEGVRRDPTDPRFAGADARTKRIIEQSTNEAYQNPLMYAPGMIGMSMLPLGLQSAIGLSSGAANIGAGNYKTGALEMGLGALPFAPTVLKNIYKINPWAFKPNPEAYYRMIGQEGLQDAIESGVIRPKVSSSFKIDYPTFKKGVPLDDRYGRSVIDNLKFPGPYMVESIGNKMVQNRWTQAAPDADIFIPRRQLTTDNPGLTFYKEDWLRGYKPVKVKKVDDVSRGFKSEIDWAKWNPETPNYPELINEYNAIEQSTKANGTWMKNPDGSPFQGAPEQFVQQQSSWFKKAFPNVVKNEAGNVQINYHGSPNVLKQFDPSKQINGRIYGEGVYTTPDINLAKRYATGNNPQMYELYLNANNPRNASNYIQEGITAAENKLSKIENQFGKSSKEYKEAIEVYNNDLEFLRKNRTKIDLRKHSINGTPEDYMKIKDIQVTPFTNYPKSALGNVGFFDMTNPNIYKSLIPGAVGLKALQESLQQPEQQKQDGGVLNMNTNKMLNYINASYQKGGGIKDMVVSEIWEKVTGTKWSQAKKLGLSDGSYETNIKLRQMLINEAMQPKPNFGKFIGQPSSKLPAPSAIVNQLRQEGLAQASMPQDATARVKPIVLPAAPGTPSKQQPAQKRTYPKVEIPGYHTAPPNTSATAKRQMQRVEGLTPVTSVKSVPLQKVQTPTQAVAMPSSTRVAAPTMSPVVGRAPVPLPQQAEKPQLALVNPPIGQPTYSEQDKPESAPSDLSTMGTLSMLNMAPVVGGVQAATTYAPMMARNAAAGLYNATIGPEIDYLTDPNSAVLPNFVRAALPLPLNVANSISYLMGAGMAMDDRSLSDDQKRVVYEAALNAAKKGKKSFTYEDYPTTNGNSVLIADELKRGKIGFLDAVKTAFSDPFQIASTIGGSNFEFGPDSSLKVLNVSDWNPEDANFSNPNSPYQYYRNYLRNRNRERIQNMTPEERAEEDKRNTISLTIPASIMQEQKAGGAKRSLKIRIRKNG